MSLVHVCLSYVIFVEILNKFLEVFVTFIEAYSETCPTSKMKCFAEVVHD